MNTTKIKKGSSRFLKKSENPDEKKYGKYSLMNIKRDFHMNKGLYLLMIPVLLYYIYFRYVPMFGAIIAFKDFSPALGILGSPWVGFEHFIDFFTGIQFGRILKNTLTISIASLIFCFPAPILLALLINEVTYMPFKKSVQTITYLPHFISLVVICSMIKEFTSADGIITHFVALLGGSGENMLNNAKLFVPIYIVSDIWQTIGWSSILYLAALTTIDSELYEAAKIDGAGRIRQVIYVTIPGIMPTIITMFILRLGSVLNVGYEKILLLYSPMNYETSDVISTYVYRAGLQEFKYDFASAVGLFNSVINFFLVYSANLISRKVSETSLW